MGVPAAGAAPALCLGFLTTLTYRMEFALALLPGSGDESRVSSVGLRSEAGSLMRRQQYEVSALAELSVVGRSDRVGRSSVPPGAAAEDGDDFVKAVQDDGGVVGTPEPQPAADLETAPSRAAETSVFRTLADTTPGKEAYQANPSWEWPLLEAARKLEDSGSRASASTSSSASTAVVAKSLPFSDVVGADDGRGVEAVSAKVVPAAKEVMQTRETAQRDEFREPPVPKGPHRKRWIWEATEGTAKQEAGDKTREEMISMAKDTSSATVTAPTSGKRDAAIDARIRPIVNLTVNPEPYAMAAALTPKVAATATAIVVAGAGAGAMTNGAVNAAAVAPSRHDVGAEGPVGATPGAGVEMRDVLAHRHPVAAWPPLSARKID